MRYYSGPVLEGCISCEEEKSNEQVWSLHLIVSNLNLSQYVANKIERK